VRRLLPRPQQRLLNQLRSNPGELDDDDDDGVDITDLHIAYRRPTLILCDENCDHPEEELSDHIIFRLQLARQLAMRAYKKAQA